MKFSYINKKVMHMVAVENETRERNTVGPTVILPGLTDLSISYGGKSSPCSSNYRTETNGLMIGLGET